MARKVWSCPSASAIGDHAGRPPPWRRLAALEEQVHDLVLVEEPDAVLDALLVERLQDHVAGSVGRVAGPPDRRLAVVAGVAAEAALVDLAVRRAIERQAHVLELDDRLDRLAGQDLGGVLVDQVVAALDGVEHVPLPVVLLEVAESGADTALGGAGVGAGGIELGQDGGVDALAGQLQSGPQTGAAGADDDRIERVVHRYAGWSLAVMTTSVPMTKITMPTRYRRHQGQRPPAAMQVVHRHRPHAQEGVREDDNQEQPVEAADQEVVPALAE